MANKNTGTPKKVSSQLRMKELSKPLESSTNDASSSGATPPATTSTHIAATPSASSGNREYFVDGQLSFKIRKTKNQDIMRQSLSSFKQEQLEKRMRELKIKEQ